jgi:fatty-acyl-CoA synthase
MNLGTLLTQTARRFPDRPALVWGERTWSWAQLEARVNTGVAALRGRGVGKGDRILVHARNSNAMFESMWIAFRLGAVWVPTNYRLAAPEVAYIAKSSRPRVLLYDTAFTDIADAAIASAHDPIDVIVAIGAARSGEIEYEDLIATGVSGARATVEPAAVDYDDPLWFFFTSGTTGRPKAAMLTHGQMTFVVVNHLCDLMPGTTEADASLVAAPLSHGAGIHALTQVARGALSVLMPGDKFDPQTAWQLVERHRVTNMFAVPTIVRALVEHPAVDRYDHSSLRYVVYAGAPMYRADQKVALAKLGSVLVQYFGLGEVTGNITVLPPRDHTLEDDPSYPIGSCGYARTGMEIAAFGEHGEPRAAGEPGELCVRGPAVFAGYYDDPAANAKAFRDGWFRTGDVGYLDPRGYVYITGRASDMYISGGSNVYPREIEEVLLTHPAIAEAAVVGIPHEKWGEAGVAVLVKRPGADCSEADVFAHLDGKLARYKRPAAIAFWDELPKSGYGKVLKAKIAERLRLLEPA